MLQMRAAL